MRSISTATVNTQMKQHVANYAKAGAYYTQLDHCDAISRYFNFEEGSEYCILEPSIGDAQAVEHVVNKRANDGKHIFGVELNRATYESIKGKDTLRALICADFIVGTKISTKRFSFIFSNPPYGDYMDDIRQEERFLDKIGSLSMNGAYLVWVVPFSSFVRERHLKMMLNHWEVLKIMKFHKEEYEKYHQIVVIARKTSFQKRTKLYEEYAEKFSTEGIEGIEEIDFAYDGPKFNVSPSSPDEINYFATRYFNYDDMYDYQKQFDVLDSYNHFFMTEKYSLEECGQPPIMPKKDSLCLASYGTGYCLTGEKGQTHLYRGTAKVVEENYVETRENADEKSKKADNLLHVITRTSLQSKIIEESGRITTF